MLAQSKTWDISESHLLQPQLCLHLPTEEAGLTACTALGYFIEPERSEQGPAKLPIPAGLPTAWHSHPGLCHRQQTPWGVRK